MRCCKVDFAYRLPWGLGIPRNQWKPRVRCLWFCIVGISPVGGYVFYHIHMFVWVSTQKLHYHPISSFLAGLLLDSWLINNSYWRCLSFSMGKNHRQMGPVRPSVSVHSGSTFGTLAIEVGGQWNTNLGLCLPPWTTSRMFNISTIDIHKHHKHP